METNGDPSQPSSVPLVPPDDWDRCHAYLEPKKRFCRQRPADSSLKYCGNHQHLLEGEYSTTGRKRIPCPLDPSHLIFEDMVEKHISVCPLAKKRKRHAEQDHYKENINSGGHGDVSSESISKEDSSGTLEWAQKLALRVLNVHQHIFAQESSKTNPIPPTQISWKQLHDSIPLCDLSQPELDAGIVEGFKANRIKSGGARHIPQLASLVGHLRSIGVLPSLESRALQPKQRPLTLLEMGAGRGMFGLAAAGVAASNEIPTRLVMVERTGSRSKADKIFRTLPTTTNDTRNSYLKLDAVKWSRLECDLAHVNLPVVLKADDKKGDSDDADIVLIAKHLCGAGTDLALKSMEPIRDQVKSCLLATCCHGICNWNDYVGRDYLRQVMQEENSTLTFGPLEFDLMRQWCAGSVACQTKPSAKEGSNIAERGNGTNEEGVEDECEHTVSVKAINTEPTASTAKTRVNISAVVESLKLICGIEGLGRACQRLIDYGRLEYLRNVIFAPDAPSSCKLLHYVPPDVSPQNACLIASRHSGVAPG